MSSFQNVAKLDDIPEDCGVEVEVDGRSIGLFRRGDTVYALDALCPHRQGPLGEGEVDEDVVICPWHGWEFELHTGRCLTDTEHAVARFGVKVEDGDVWVSSEELED